MAKIVIALGGNALGNDAAEQLEKSQLSAKSIVDLIVAGNQVVIVHGNGPQVGQIRLAFETGFKNGATPLMSYPECTAMSQGYIGYHLQQSIDAELESRGLSDIPVVTILTQIVVDENDPSFKTPTKPVGGYYTEEAAKKLMETSDDIYVEDSGRGYRRVVASPKPIDIYEKVTLKTLNDAGQVVITCGGGGIPVVSRDGHYEGVNAVIDKDFAAAKMADLIGADVFIILTAVDRICINFNKPNQKELSTLTCAEAEKYAAEGHFAPGSMLPKVQAACEFVEGRKDRKSIIGSLEKAALTLDGKSGTIIMG